MNTKDSIVPCGLAQLHTLCNLELLIEHVHAAKSQKHKSLIFIVDKKPNEKEISTTWSSRKKMTSFCSFSASFNSNKAINRKQKSKRNETKRS